MADFGDELAVEFGVEWRSDDGHSFVAAGYTEAAARALAAECAGKGWSPRAERAMRRIVGEWEPLIEDGGA